MAQTQVDYVHKIKKEEQEMKIAEEDLQKFISSLETQQPISGNINLLDQNIFQDNKVKPKKVSKAYSTTKAKARNLLTNVSYTRWNDDDFKKKSLMVGILTYFVQFLNLSGLDWKLVTEEERNQVKFIWEDCLPIEFLHYTLEEENYETLGVLNLNYQKCTEIVTNYLKQDESRLPPLIEAVRNNLVVFRYAFATLFPKIYSRIDSDGIKEKIAFEYKYHNWWNRKYNAHHYQQSQIQCANDLLDGSFEEVPVKLAKNTASVVPTNPNEQKPIVDTEKFAVFKKTVLSKPKTRKEIVSQNAQKRRMKRKAELEKKLNKNTQQWEMIKNFEKKKPSNSLKTL